MELHELFSALDQRKAALDSFRPLPVAAGIARSLDTYLEVVTGCKPEPLLTHRRRGH